MLRYAKRVLRCSISTNVGCIPSADHPHCAPWPHCSQWAAHSHNAKADANANSMRPLVATRCTLRPQTFAFSAFARPVLVTTIIPTTNNHYSHNKLSQVSRRRVPRNVGRERTCDLRRTSAEARRAQAVKRAYKRCPILISLALSVP